MKDSDVLIGLNDIVFGYPGAAPVINGLNFSLRRNDRIGLIAPNGSGKTTLFHLIMGLLKPTAGHLEIFGNRVRRRKRLC